MKILQTACGNINEAYIENRFTDGVNIIFSNDNNKGKTIVFQGMMYALGNEPIFPSGFDYKAYYFYTSVDIDGIVYEFLRHNNSFAVKCEDRIEIFDDQSSLKYYLNLKVFPIPIIEKNGLRKLVDLNLLYELFFIGQDKRNPSNIINTGYYNKQDFVSMIYALAGCLTTNDSVEKLRRLRENLQECKANIETLNKRLTFYRDHPEIASAVSQNADRENLEKQRKEYQALNDMISVLQKKRTRITNRCIRLRNLLSELNSLSMHVKCGEIRCQDCGSSNIIYTNTDLSFELLQYSYAEDQKWESKSPDDGFCQRGNPTGKNESICGGHPLQSDHRWIYGFRIPQPLWQSSASGNTEQSSEENRAGLQ